MQCTSDIIHLQMEEVMGHCIMVQVEVVMGKEVMMVEEVMGEEVMVEKVMVQVEEMGLMV